MDTSGVEDGEPSSWNCCLYVMVGAVCVVTSLALVALAGGLW